MLVKEVKITFMSTKWKTPRVFPQIPKIKRQTTLSDPPTKNIWSNDLAAPRTRYIKTLYAFNLVTGNVLFHTLPKNDDQPCCQNELVNMMLIWYLFIVSALFVGSVIKRSPNIVKKSKWIDGLANLTLLNSVWRCSF